MFVLTRTKNNHLTEITKGKYNFLLSFYLFQLNINSTRCFTDFRKNKFSFYNIYKIFKTLDYNRLIKH